MLELITLYSGSSGNCVYVSDGTTRLLIDCGVSGKRIEMGLNSIGVAPETVHGVLLTHEHSDHIASVGILHRRYGWQLYANRPTWQAAESVVGKYRPDCVHFFCGDFSIGDILVTPFAIPHDAAAPVGYRFSQGAGAVSVATDIGKLTGELAEHLSGSDCVLLEANHDEEMLKAGPYPYPLKRRILGERGHLSNENAGRLCAYLAKTGTKHILLGHLSVHNNMPELAYQTVLSAMQEQGVTDRATLQVAPRERCSISCRTEDTLCRKSG